MQCSQSGCYPWACRTQDTAWRCARVNLSKRPLRGGRRGVSGKRHGRWSSGDHHGDHRSVDKARQVLSCRGGVSCQVWRVRASGNPITKQAANGQPWCGGRRSRRSSGLHVGVTAGSSDGGLILIGESPMLKIVQVKLQVNSNRPHAAA